jgi:hypothetical protein
MEEDILMLKKEGTWAKWGKPCIFSILVQYQGIAQKRL